MNCLSDYMLPLESTDQFLASGGGGSEGMLYFSGEKGLSDYMLPLESTDQFLAPSGGAGSEGMPRAIHEVSRRGAGTRRKRPAEFSCPHDSCGNTFTTKYGLKSASWPSFILEVEYSLSVAGHVNRFHTPPEQQIRYSCEICGKTIYRSGLARHQKHCSQRQHTTQPSSSAYVWNL